MAYLDLNKNALPFYLVGADGNIVQLGRTQGMVANGAANSGDPVQVAGTDGTNIRTLLTTTSGAIRLGISSTSAAGGGQYSSDTATFTSVTGLDVRANLTLAGLTTVERVRSALAGNATSGVGLLGAGVLGQFATALPVYTDGQFGTINITNRGDVRTTLVGANGTPITIADIGSDGASQTRNSVSSSAYGYVFNGTTWDRSRGDTNGAYMQVRGSSGLNAEVSTYGIGPATNAVALRVSGHNYNYSDATGTLVSQKGDQVGSFVKERSRARFATETAGAVAASASINGLSRDATPDATGVTEWAKFEMLARADVAGTLVIQGSTDGSTWQNIAVQAATANTAVILSTGVFFQYNRGVFLNSTTAGNVLTFRTRYTI